VSAFHSIIEQNFFERGKVMRIRDELMTNTTSTSPPQQEVQGEVGFLPGTRQMSTTSTSHPSRGRQILRFLRHFGEMVLAMLLGMGVFGVVNSAILIPMGFVYLSASLFPEAYAASMAVSMTIPMVAWMRIRKHAWRLSAEMAGAMIVPSVLLIAICLIGLLPHTVVVPGTHLLMLPAMLGAMLYRWRDYTCH
jgi:hypothetical protein